MKIRAFQNKSAVAEMIGEILLLAIAVSAVAIIYTQLSATQHGPQDIANVTMIGKMEQGSPVFKLQRGESLGPDTKIFLTLGGVYRMEYSYNEFFNQEWNIGDRIVIPREDTEGDITGLQVEATIVDTKTNSIVFWGILQEGLTLPGRGKGGIWHFDEPIWNSIPNEVIDSSGNNNHGIALSGAKITTSGKSNNAGYFDGFNDAVKVKTSWTLNITKSITIEAWMKPTIPQFMLDIMGVNGTFGYTPYIIPVVGDIYALVSEDYQKGCQLTTVKIDSEGSIAYIENLILGKSTGSNICQPKIIQMTEKTYVLSYIDEKYHLNLQTINISANGSIEYINKLVFTEKSDTNNPNSPSLQKITDNLCAIAYWAPSNGGILKTVEISTGKINDTVQYDPVAPGNKSREPYLVHVTGNLFVLAYRGPSDLGILKTFNIASDGNITYTGQMVQFETGSAYEPCLINVSKKVFAVTYRNTLDKGYIKTFNISANGSIVLTGKKMVFEPLKCYNPCIIHGADDTYVIAYSTGAIHQSSADGYVITLRIEQNGSINPIIGLRKQFAVPDGETCHYPIIIHLADHLYAISFTGPIAHTGYLITILIGQHGRGIFKGDSFMLYANTTTAVGSINNMKVSYNISLGSDWHHFALTYDGMSIRLYINGVKVSETSYPNHRINLTADSLYFGRFYCGYIDEVAIYDKALTQEEILIHFRNPGALE